MAERGGERRAGRGRPRSEKAHRAIVDAAGSLMLEGGINAVTMEAIAARAGVSKATIYKWWPSRGAVALEWFLDQVKGSIESPNELGVREALAFQLEKVAALLRDPKLAPLLSGIISQAETDPEIARALRDNWVTPRRAVSKAIVNQAIEEGELRSDLDADVFLDQLFSPLYRVVFGLAPYSTAQTKQLVDQLFDGVAGG